MNAEAQTHVAALLHKFDPGVEADVVVVETSGDRRLDVPIWELGGKGVFDFPPPGDGELDMTGLLAILDEAGYAGPISAEVEFNELGWPDYDVCLAAAKRSCSVSSSIPAPPTTSRRARPAASTYGHWEP